MQIIQNKQFYEFGAFRLDVQNRLLWRGGEQVALTLKEFEVLFFLVENAGEVVDKDRLLDAVWRDVFIEEGTLTRNISRLRKKLEARDDGSNGAEKIIETLPKRGYRFLPAVTKTIQPAPVVVEEKTRTHIRIEETVSLDGDAASEIQNAATAPPAVSLTKIDSGAFAAPEDFSHNSARVSDASSRLRLPAAPQKTNRLLLPTLLGSVLLFAAAFLVYQFYFRRAEPRVWVASRVEPFSGAAGLENTPSFSPDGKQLAFAWNAGENDNLDVYVRLVSAGEPVRLTDSEFTEQYPVFSPDGSHVAFVREFKTHGEVLLVPALGGAERRVARLFSGNFSISFSPDGNTLAVVDTEDSTDKKQYAIYLINLQTGERRRLTVPGNFRGETTPRFSPDGNFLAFVRVFDDKQHDLFVVPVTGGEPKQLTFDQKIIHSLAWSADGSAIFFASFRASNRAGLWRLAATGGSQPEIVSTGGREITNLAASPDGKTIAFVENVVPGFDIWSAAETGKGAKRLLSSTHSEFDPALAPDGSRVVFTSNRTGKTELWMTDAAGKNLRQLTATDLPVGTPTFAPDGSRIAFDTSGNETQDLFVVSAEGGGAARRLTAADDARDFLPSWSADGKWIYFTSNRAGDANIWKMPSEGGEAVQITRQGAYQAFPAPDGETVFYTRAKRGAELWRVSTNGETEQPAPEFAAAGFAGIWTMTRAGVYFLAPDSEEFYKIKFYDFASRQIRDLPGDRRISNKTHHNPTVSADGKVFLYAQQNPDASNIMLAELQKP